MSKMKAPDVDSRWYAFSYPLRSEEDVPADFPIPESAKGFRIGLFLPRGDPDWFGRSPYPPRILLFRGDSLLVLTHPLYNEAPLQVDLSKLVFFETGHILLIGWLRFVTAEFEVHLPYNTRSERLMSEFLNCLMNVYLSNAVKACAGEIAEHGAALDIKFRNHLIAALRKEEFVSARWFSPPTERIRRWGPFQVRRDVGGDLIAVTNQRAIWIRDTWNGYYEPYGCITSTAPLGSVNRVEYRPTSKDSALTIAFHSGVSWRIPLSPAVSREAEAFAESLASGRPLQEAAP